MKFGNNKFKDKKISILSKSNFFKYIMKHSYFSCARSFIKEFFSDEYLQKFTEWQCLKTLKDRYLNVGLYKNNEKQFRNSKIL